MYVSLEKLQKRTVKLSDTVKSRIEKVLKNKCSEDFGFLSLFKKIILCMCLSLPIPASLMI